MIYPTQLITYRRRRPRLSENSRRVLLILRRAGLLERDLMFLPSDLALDDDQQRALRSLVRAGLFRQEERSRLASGERRLIVRHEAVDALAEDV